MSQNTRDYYFAGIRLTLPEISMPDSWKQFEKKQPFRFSVSLSLSEEMISVDPGETKSYGRANVVRREDGWIFIKKEREIPRLKLPGKEEMQALRDAGLPILPVVEKKPREEKKDFPGLKASKDYTECVLCSNGERKDTMAMLHTAVDAALPLHGGSIIHASCVVYKGKAILFCGPSGMGKSTQAGLWEERFRTHMISSDAPAVYPDSDGGATAYGMPWDGSDQIFSQESAPVAAVIELGQARKNLIRPMSTGDAYERLLQQGHLPLWDETAMHCELEVLKKIAMTVPFWHLDCLPNTEAAELTEQTLRRVFEGSL